MKKFTAIVIITFCAFFGCKKTTLDWTNSKRMELKWFTIELPNNCSFNERFNEEIYRGVINCSGMEFRYQYGNMITDNLPKGELINDYHRQTDTINILLEIWSGQRATMIPLS